MNELLLYLKQYFYPSSQHLNVDTFSELIFLLLHQDKVAHEPTAAPVKFPHGFVGNQGYDLFVQLITTLHPQSFMKNTAILNQLNKNLTECKGGLLVHQSSSKNQSLDIVIGAKNSQSEVLGFQTIITHQKHKWIYSFTWNRPRQNEGLRTYDWDLNGHIFCIPSTVAVTRGFIFKNQKHLELTPYPDACFDANVSYFLFSLEKKSTATYGVTLTYSRNRTEQQFEYYDFLKQEYLIQTQPRALHHIEKPAFNLTLPREKWTKNPYPTLCFTQPSQTPALHEPNAATTLEHTLKMPQTINIQDNLSQIHQHPLPPIWISVIKNFNNSVPNNSFFQSEIPNQYSGNNIIVTYNPDNQQAQRISFSFGFFRKNTLLIGTRFTYQLTSEQYSVSQERGLFNFENVKTLQGFTQPCMLETNDDDDNDDEIEFPEDLLNEASQSERYKLNIDTQQNLSRPPIQTTGHKDNINEFVCGKKTQYCTNGATRQPVLETVKSPNAVTDNRLLSQVNTIFHSIFNSIFPHDELIIQEETSIGYMDKCLQEELTQLSGYFRFEIDDQCKDIVKHQIARFHRCLNLTKTIATTRAIPLEHLSLSDMPSKAQIQSGYLETILREWRTLSHSVLEKIQTEEQRAWQSLIKQHTQSYLTIHAERFLKQKIRQAEQMLGEHECIQVMYGAFFQHAIRLFQSTVLEKEQAFIMAHWPVIYYTRIAQPQHRERTLLYSQFNQEKQSVINRQIQTLMWTERLERRFLMFSLANEYATEVMNYHQKQAILERYKLFLHGERIHKQVHHYIEHMTTKLPENNHRSTVDLLQEANNAGLINDAILTGSAARGSALANDIDLKIFVKNDATPDDHQRLLKMLSALILASTKRYIRTDNALLTLEFMGPKGLPFNLVIFFLDNKKTEYPPLYQEDIVVRFNFTTASWEFFHEVVDYPDQSEKRGFSLRCQPISEPVKIAEVLTTQLFNIKRQDEPGAVLRVLRDMAYFPTKAIYNEKKLAGIWQDYNDLQKDNMANMAVLFLNGDDKNNIPPKIHSHQQAKFKSLVSIYFPDWERHCDHQARPNATTTFFRNNTIYYGIAGVIEKIGNASSKVALEHILSDIDTMGIDNAVLHWKKNSLQTSSSSRMAP